MQAVCLQYVEQLCLPLFHNKLRVGGEGAVDVSVDDVINVLLTYADLAERGVAGLWVDVVWDGPRPGGHGD